MAGTANVPGGGEILPSVVTNIQTQTAGASVPGGIRVAAFIGLGGRTETLVSSAVGNGNDGLNSSFTSSSGSDGRHFKLSVAPIISNRTTIYKNGAPLTRLEETPDNLGFSHSYDYRIDTATGNFELQQANLVDQDGLQYSVGANNVGLGSIPAIILQDPNAPTETWTIKCVSVQRGVGNVPIQETAKFIAFGSVSGNVLDGYGNSVVWVSNGTFASNTILSFAIAETQVSSISTSPFRDGDYFTVQVVGGALKKSDSLTATYIAESDLNDPVFYDNTKDTTIKHGSPSLDNTLSLGLQLAFANTTPGIMTVQAAPSMPRRQSYVVSTSVDATSSNNNDFILPLPIGVKPGVDTTVHFFVTNPTTGVETQILPNKFSFYTLTGLSTPTLTQFITSNTAVPSGNSFSYSVIESTAAVDSGSDGVITRSSTRTTSTFSSSNSYNSDYIGKNLFIFDAVNKANNGTFIITNVIAGQLIVNATAIPPFPDFINETNVSFRLLNGTTLIPIAGTTASDGALLKITNTSQGTITSAAINFLTFNPLVNHYKVEITSSVSGNVGIFDIVGYNSSTDKIQFAKTFITETSLNYEILDTAAKSCYVVVNHNVVPNGNSLRVTVVDENDASFFDAGWENALASLETQEVDIVVPLPKQTISSIFQTTLSHCKVMSDNVNKKERILFCGAINGLTPDNLTGAKSAAVEDIGILEGLQGDSISEILSGNTEDLTNYKVSDAFGNTYRCVYFGPDQIVVQIGADNTIVDGFYLGAAAAGYLCGVSDISQPLTRKVMTGFSILRSRQYSNRVLRQLATAGVTMLQPVAGGGRVIWGITTTQSGFVEEEEISIVFIRDRIAKNFRAGLDGFIGTAESIDTIPTIATRADLLLKGFISQGLITDYKDLTVKRDSVVPTQFNVSARCQPVYSVNFIYVSVGVGLL